MATTATVSSAEGSDASACKTAIESLGVATADNNIITWTVGSRVFFAISITA